LHYSLHNDWLQNIIFFTPHHGRWRQQGNELDKRCNDGIQGHLKRDPRPLLQKREPTMAQVHIVAATCATMSNVSYCNNVFKQRPLFSVATMCSNNVLGSVL
jgi:hypothetical protein